MTKGIMLAIASLAFFEGCGTMGNKPAQPPETPKIKAPYHIEFDTKAASPNPAGVSLPAINYTANSKALERRASLVVRFDPAGVKRDQPGTDQMIMAPVDLTEATGTLPSSYMDSADKGLAKMLGNSCMKGTVKVTVVLVRSSIKPDADDAEINAKRLSDWVPTEVVFKNAHPKC